MHAGQFGRSAQQIFVIQFNQEFRRLDEAESGGCQQARQKHGLRT